MDLNILTYLGIMLLAALIAGKIVKQMRLPNVTGYLVIGLLIGPNCLKILSEELIDHMDLVTELALGCIAFSIGAEFKTTFLKKVGKAPLVIGITEGVGAVLVVDTILLMLGYNVSFALALGAIASATAAASTMMIVKQYKTKGPVTSTLLPVVALDDAVALIAYGLSMAVANVISSSGSGKQASDCPLCRDIRRFVIRRGAWRDHDAACKSLYRTWKPACNHNHDDLPVRGRF